MSRRYWALILNFNHWLDTIQCAESLLASAQPPERIILCDNGSTDASLERLAKWAEGLPGQDAQAPVAHITRAQAESGMLPPGRIVLVSVGSNLGYAGGNNVGLRLALASDVPFVWILNNDTLVFPDTPGALLEHMCQNEKVGLCGALTRYMEEPEIVQCLGGGWHNPVWGRTGLYGDGDFLPRHKAPENLPERLDYVNGASVFVRRDFLLDVGLMEEAYFLYCEELDWAARAKGRWAISWEPDAQVLHREGATTGASKRRRQGHGVRLSAMLLRSRLLFTLKHHPFFLPTVLIGQVLALFKKLLQ